LPSFDEVLTQVEKEEKEEVRFALLCSFCVGCRVAVSSWWNVRSVRFADCDEKEKKKKAEEEAEQERKVERQIGSGVVLTDRALHQSRLCWKRRRRSERRPKLLLLQR
jgi:hypothetical protein